MAVGYISAQETIRTATTDPYTFSATVPATCRGILLTSAHNVSVTDHVPPANAVTIGGKAMGKLHAAVDSATEPGRAEMWFLGHDLPTAGAQTLSVDLTSATTDDFQFVLIYLSGATDLEPIALAKDEADQANPSAVLAYGGRTAMSFGVLFSGLDAEASITAGTNCTAIHTHDFGTQTASVIQQTAAGSADFTIGWTAASDDVAAVYVAISEEQSSPVRAGLLALSPTGLWMLGEPVGCLQAFDRSPNLRHGIYNGGITLGSTGLLSGDASTSALFNGSTGYVQIADNNAFTLGTTNALSVVAWATRVSTSGSSKALVAKYGPSAYEWLLRQTGDATHSAVLEITDSGSAVRAIGTTADIPAGTNMLAATADETADSLIVYVNGVSAATDTTWTLTGSNTAAPVRIGAYDSGFFYNGSIQAAALFSTVLTPTQVSDLYTLGLGATSGTFAATVATVS